MNSIVNVYADGVEKVAMTSPTVSYIDICLDLLIISYSKTFISITYLT